MAAPVLQFKRGLSANLPSLRAGEPGFATDSYDFYVGLTSQSINNKFLTSSRFWTKETATTGSGVNLVEGTNNGSDFITLASPASVGAAVTYYFPAANGSASSVLTNNGSGVLSWASGSANPVFTGISTFSDTTESTSKDTGSVILEGGLGIEKNVYIGGSLNVTGVSTFVGAATFQGGTITLGDADSDNVVFGADVNSDIIPNTDNTFDFGNSARRWRNAILAGVGTFATGAVVDSIRIGITASSEIDTSSGDLTLDSAGGQVIIDDNLSVSGVSTFTGAIDSNGGLDVTGATILNTTLSVTGVSTFTGAIDSNGGLDVTGATILNTTLSVTGVSTFTGAIDANGGADISGGETVLSSATVSDLTAERVVLAGTSGALQDSANLVFSAGGLRVGAGGINVTGISTFSADLVVGGDIRVNGNDIQASDGATNITLTSSTLTTFAGDIKVTGNDIQSSTATAITLSGADVAIAGDLTVTGNDIKSSTATVITLSADDASFVGDVTIGGDLFVNGSTTQVNTTSLTVEDTLIELGFVNGVAPTSDFNKDLGLLLNYFSGTAKKAAVFWDDSTSRIVVASEVSETTGVLTPSVYAAFEIGSLFVNDCAGASQVISCTGTTRNLENITIDGGSF